MMTRLRGDVLLAAAFYAAGASSVVAVPPHFEKVKFELIGQHINCTHCHVSDESAELTAYGKAIGDRETNRSVPQRVRDMERSPKQPGDNVDEAADVDGDGIPNWVEILAGLNPSEADEAYDLTKRIEANISCGMCHTAVNQPGQSQEERAPHNAFGDALAKLNQSGGGDRERGGRVDILERLKRLKSRDTDDDSVRNWDEIVLFYSAADAEDVPSTEDVETTAKELKRRRPSKEGFGREHPDDEMEEAERERREAQDRGRRGGRRRR